MNLNKRFQLCNIWCSKRYPPFHTAFLFVMCVVIYETDSGISLSIPPTKSQDWWYYFGTALSHFSRNHLLSNISGIILFGTLLEIVHGTFASIFIYWIASGTGSLAEAQWNTGRVIYTGASPGVFAFSGAYLAHVILNWNEAPLRLLWLLFLILQTIEVVVLYANDESYRNGIAHYSHLFGFIQGVLVGLITLRNIKIIWWENYLQFAAFFASATLILVPSILISTKVD